MKKKALLFLFFALALLVSINLDTKNAFAKVKLSKSKLTLTVGKTYTLKLKKAKKNKKIKWKSSKKSVAKVASNGKILAKKVGKATITAIYGKKKYKCKVKVKKATAKLGSQKNPISAYNTNTITYYEAGKKIGTFSIKLLDFSSGNQAATMAKNDSTNPIPNENQEYIYFQFQIKYVSSAQKIAQTVNARDLFNYTYNLYGSNSTYQIKNLDWGFSFDGVEDMSTVTLALGNKIICSKAILINKGYDPVTFKIQTGKDSYTWFTTAK